jgi:hypothetical protein
VRERLNAEQLGLSPFVRLQLAYLHEAGKISVPAETITDDLVRKLELRLTDPPAARLCQAASWPR